MSKEQCRSWFVALAAALVLGAPLAAGEPVDAVILPGDTFLGDIATPGDVDVVITGAVRGTFLRVVVKPTPTSTMRPAVELIDETTGEVLIRKVAKGRRKVVVRSMQLPSTGVYTIRVRGADASTGEYCVLTKGRVPQPVLRKVVDETIAAGESLKVSFDAARGFVLRAVVGPDAGSPAIVADPRVLGPTGEVKLELTASGAKTVMQSEDMPLLGSYVLVLENGGGTGRFVGRLKLQQAKHVPVIHHEPDGS